MRNIMKLRFIFGLAVVLALGLSACQDLTVENLNNPDRTKALASPADVEKLASDTFTNYWAANQYSASSMNWSTVADEISSSWANWGMRDMSSEPRIAWNNDPAYNREEFTEAPWFGAYRCISNASDALIAVEGNEAVFESDGVDTNRLKAFSKFNLALCLGTLGMRFDRAFIVDETTDLEAVALGQVDLDLAPYTEVIAKAVSKLDEAIAIASANTFTITADDDWIYGLDVTNTDLVRLANSFAARFLANSARTPEERAAVDWGEVIRRVDSGITQSFSPIGDDNGDIREWDSMKFFGQNHTTWARADYRSVGPADESGGYASWLATPVQQRNVYDGYSSSDRRITGAGGPTDSGSYFRYVGVAGPFPSARGTYHYATHTHNRFLAYNQNNANGPMNHMEKAEMDLYKAEGLLRTGGSTATVAQLINTTRVANGELPPATGATAAGGPSDGSWKNTGIHLNGTLWGYLEHEFRMETFATAGGLAYTTDRGWGDLVQGTPIHYPVPGAELETLALDNYTFGGVGGDGGAPKNRPDRYLSIEERNVRVK
jgi:hypothetical protein